MSKLLNSSHPSALVYILKVLLGVLYFLILVQNHPRMFDLSVESFVDLIESSFFPEIVYRICSIKWKEFNHVTVFISRDNYISFQEEKWDKFFDAIVENKDEIPSYLFDYVIASPNCTAQQLLTGLEELCGAFLHKSPI